MKLSTKIFTLFFISFSFIQTLEAQKASLLIEDLLFSSVSKTQRTQSNVGFNITGDHTSEHSGIRHIYFEQNINGIPVLNTGSSAHFKNSNQPFKNSNNFLKVESNIRIQSKQPLLSTKEALAKIVKFSGISDDKIFIERKNLETENKIIFKGGSISQRDIPVRLRYLLHEEELRLIYQIEILEFNNKNWMVYTVDTTSGEVYSSINILKSCDSSGLMPDIETISVENKEHSKVKSESMLCDNCYEVFPYPLENAFFGPRQIVTNPANVIASPFGWHDTNGSSGGETQVTSGNNTDVFINGSPEKFRPNGGSSLDFSGTEFDVNYSLSNASQSASVVNVFYWSNLMHDILYLYGFDEAGGNFQLNNYGSPGGEELDPLSIAVQDGNGCNAFFGSPIDGESPFMVIDTCGNKDGGFDNSVIIHEYGHGLVERLVGGPNYNNCLMGDENMIEGYADWLGILFTMSSSDTKDRQRGVGNFFRSKGPQGAGIRTYPYTTDLTTNPETYGSLIDLEGSIHATGAVWGEMLWEMTWVLIDQYGFNPELSQYTGNVDQDAGNIMALAIVVESLKLLDCTQKSFVEARDAIIEANAAIYGRDNECIIINAFAKRGLGIYADGGDSSRVTDNIEDFTPYITDAVFNQSFEICLFDNIKSITGGALPKGGVYSGQGIIDDGNGFSFKIDPEEAGLGTHEITYSISDSACNNESSSISSFSVTIDTTVPDIVCPEKTDYFLDGSGNSIYLENLKPKLVIDAFCKRDDYVIIQNPPPGTVLTYGDMEVNFTLTDFYGNVNECTTTINVQYSDSTKDIDTQIFLSPNPASEFFELTNFTASILEKATIYSISGQFIKQVLLDNETPNFISTEDLSSGLYFVKIETNKNLLLRNLIIK